MSKKKDIDFFNLRVFKHIDERGNEWLAIHDAYYSKEDKENPHSYSSTPVNVVGNDLEDLSFPMSAKEVLVNNNDRINNDLILSIRN
tara:strand:- start:36556 stop:36816 length:261 start_codon:yes stop_codon:yes gene_type:complete